MLCTAEKENVVVTPAEVREQLDVINVQVGIPPSLPPSSPTPTSPSLL